MKSPLLPASHYAVNWNAVVLPLEECNRLGREYALLPAGAEKRGISLRIVQAFHGYLLKYLTMICRGHTPMENSSGHFLVNDDTKRFIQYFLPRGTPFVKAAISQVCSSFHLAFKGMKTDEIYDVLMEQLLKAAVKYDPLYSEKVAKVVATIGTGKRLHLQSAQDTGDYDGDHEKGFTIDELNQHLDFNGTRFVRVLCRHGFLEPAPEQSGDARRRYRRKADTWPPPYKYLHAGPIGFTYYLQTWFRYYLQIHIEHARGEIEAREGTYSLDYDRKGNRAGPNGENGDVLDARGSLVGCDGPWWLDKVTTDKCDLDLGRMDLEWVQHTEDPLFAGLERGDRLVLYLIFVREYTWEKLADALQVSTTLSKCRYLDIIDKLRSAAGVEPPCPNPAKAA
jgi:hypothetical protein